MTDQLALFDMPGVVTTTAEIKPVRVDKYGKPRGKHYTQPRGYAFNPGTGPANETCGTCKFIGKVRRWAKCYHDFARRKHTHGRGSDILVRSPACKYWEANDGGA